MGISRKTAENLIEIAAKIWRKMASEKEFGEITYNLRSRGWWINSLRIQCECIS